MQDREPESLVSHGHMSSPHVIEYDMLNIIVVNIHMNTGPLTD